MTAQVTVVRASAEHAGLLAGLFERTGCSCHCRYFHFEGDKYEWQARLASGADANRAEFDAALRRDDEQAMGVVALDGVEAVGWLKLAPAGLMTRQYQQRLFRGLPCFERDPEGVLTLGCILVDPSRRRAGVARRLVAGAVALARDLGAVSIEAFPNRNPQARDDELWQGPFDLLASEGFEVISDTGTAHTPYPVMRIELRSTALR